MNENIRKLIFLIVLLFSAIVIINEGLYFIRFYECDDIFVDNGHSYGCDYYERIFNANSDCCFANGGKHPL
jgi:hypothetical protein